METLNIMNREDLTYFLFVNSKLNELLYREDLQKLAEEDNATICTSIIANCLKQGAAPSDTTPPTTTPIRKKAAQCKGTVLE